MVIVIDDDLNPCQHEQGHAHLFDNEVESDVTFIVGPRNGETWRFPVHRCVMRQLPAFQEMLRSRSSPRIYHLEDVDKRGFEKLLRCLYGAPLNFQSIDTAIAAIRTGHRYNYVCLVNQAASYIDVELNPQNVIHVIDAIGCGFILVEDNDISTSTSIQNCLNQLRTNCFVMVDSETSKVLENEKFDDLTRKKLEFILERNTLKPQSELDVWLAVERWINRECKRLGVENTNSMKNTILAPSIHVVRFSLMKKSEFMAGPGRILPSELCDDIIRQMKSKEKPLRNEKVQAPYPISPRSRALVNEKQHKACRKNKGSSSAADKARGKLSTCMDCICRTLVCLFD